MKPGRRLSPLARFAARAAVLLVLGVAPWPCARAAAADPPAPKPGGSLWKTGSDPLQISSKTLETLGTQGLVIFTGDVVARQGEEFTLHADRVEVQIDKQTRAVQSVKAHGNVRIRKGEIIATGTDATYQAQTGVAVLTGEPKVWRDRDVVAGQKITLYLAEDRSVVEGGTSAILYQGSAQEKGAEKAPGTKPRDRSR